MIHKILFISLVWCLYSVSAISQNELSTVITLNGKLKVENPKLVKSIEANLNEFFSAIDASLETGEKPKFPKKVLTLNGANETDSLWMNSPFYCSQSKVKAKLVNLPYDVTDKNASIIEVRDIPILLDKERDLPQTLNISFNSKGLITGMDLGLNPMAFRNIMSNANGELDEARRQIVNKFLEQVRTAYNRKDLSYLKQVYSDDALIITGRELKKKVTSKKDEQGMHLNVSSQVEYTKKGKAEYLAGLQRLFSNNAYINVDFENVEIRPHPNPEFRDNVYCVSLEQDWTSQSAKANPSSKYHDEGYLFLMIDFHDQDRPEIEIRVWQSKESIEGGETPINENNVGSFER